MVAAVGKTFRPWEPKKAFALPPSPMDWLPEGHLAYFMLDLVGELDLGAIYAYYERELRGRPPHDPRMMTALLLYGYCMGITSSRQIERRTHEDVAYRVIAGNTHPDHVQISEFRRIHLGCLSELFLQVLHLCQKAGLVRLGHVSLDGTKVKANASKHKAMSYRRMKDQEGVLRDKVHRLLEQAERTDQEEDARHGVGKRGDELPEELRRAETRLERIRQAKHELEEEALHAEQPKKKSDDDDHGGSDSGCDPARGPALPSHQVPTTSEGKPTDKAQRNFTDPDSRVMVGNDKGFIQGYNAQIVVDDAHQVIVAQAVTNQPPDNEHAIPLLVQTRDNCGRAPDKASMDAGYYSANNVFGLLNLGTEPYIATGRSKHGEAVVRAPRLPKAMPVKDWMAHRLATDEGSAVYRRRKAIVEPVFGQIKQPRRFRQFGLRSTSKVRAEWSLVCTAHNLRKLHAFSRHSASPS
jgi:transposase